MGNFDYNQPDTRARIAARRKMRTGEPAATPGLRRMVGSWLSSGRAFSMALLIITLGTLYYVATAERFTVSRIRVEGVQLIGVQEVERLAAAHGQSIWLVDPVQVVEQVRTSAYVESAQVFVSLPDQITIMINERRPDLRWQSGGMRYLVDADGRVLGADTAPVTDTLVIEDRSARMLQPNDRVDPDALKLSRLLAMRLPNELGLQVASIGWDTGSGVFVTTTDQRMIIFGQTENLEVKLSILTMLLKDSTAFTYLDLRPGTPFYRNEIAGTPTPQP